jgi:integrase
MPKQPDKPEKKRVRANGEGSYRIRGDSVQFRWPGGTLTEKVDGRTAKTLRTRLAELCGMPDGYQPRLTIGAYARQYYAKLRARVEDKTLELSTYCSYEPIIQIIEKEFANDGLLETSAEEISDKISKITSHVFGKDEAGNVRETIRPYAFSVYKHIKWMLGQIYKGAAAAKKIRPTDNPMLLVPRLARPRLAVVDENTQAAPAKEYYDIDEVAQLLMTLPDNKYGHAIIVDAGCGFRGQELRPLRTWDIEPDGSVINIGKASKRKKGGAYLGNTKTPASDRIVAVPPFARQSAIWLRNHAANDYIMPNKKDGYVSYRSYLDGYNAAMKHTGLERLAPHKMRDTQISAVRYEAGEDAGVVMAMSGHSDRETMEGYAHVSMDKKQAAAEKYDTLVQTALKSYGQRLDKKPCKPHES